MTWLGIKHKILASKRGKHLACEYPKQLYIATK